MSLEQDVEFVSISTNVVVDFIARVERAQGKPIGPANQGLAGGFGGVIALVGPPDCWTIKAVVCAGVPGACITAEAAAWLLGMERRRGWPSHIGWSRAVGPARCMGTSPVVSRVCHRYV